MRDALVPTLFAAAALAALPAAQAQAQPQPGATRGVVACKASGRTVVYEARADGVLTRVQVDGRAVPLDPGLEAHQREIDAFCDPARLASYLSILRANQAVNAVGPIDRGPADRGPADAAAPPAAPTELKSGGLRQGGGLGVPVLPEPPAAEPAREPRNFIGVIADAWADGGPRGLLKMLLSPGGLFSLAIVAAALLLHRLLNRRR